MATNTILPLQPIAPARPVAGGSVAGTYNGQPVTINATGGIIGANGALVGVLPGSVADIGTGGTATPSTVGAVGTTGIPIAPNGGIDMSTITAADLLNPENWLGTPNNTPKGTTNKIPFLNISLADGVVILVGIILVAAGTFAFKQTQTVINTGGKLVKKGAQVAASVSA